MGKTRQTAQAAEHQRSEKVAGMDRHKHYDSGEGSTREKKLLGARDVSYFPGVFAFFGVGALLSEWLLSTMRDGVREREREEEDEEEEERGFCC